MYASGYSSWGERKKMRIHKTIIAPTRRLLFGSRARGVAHACIFSPRPPLFPPFINSLVFVSCEKIASHIETDSLIFLSSREWAITHLCWEERIWRFFSLQQENECMCAYIFETTIYEASARMSDAMCATMTLARHSIVMGIDRRRRDEEVQNDTKNSVNRE